MDQKNSVVKSQKSEYTPEQIRLIQDTVAQNSTHDELKLFLHNCKRLKLDPFAKQIHFVKYRGSPGTIIVGIDGFRLVASRTGKLSGIKRGALKEGGKLIGAWAEVYRTDWEHPAREEVPLVEYYKPGYNGKKSMWDKMPETMIKKVAEVAALRMAFPADLSGFYSHEEMDQATPNEPTPSVKVKTKDEVFGKPKNVEVVTSAPNEGQPIGTPQPVAKLSAVPEQSTNTTATENNGGQLVQRDINAVGLAIRQSGWQREEAREFMDASCGKQTLLALTHHEAVYLAKIITGKTFREAMADLEKSKGISGVSPEPVSSDNQESMTQTFEDGLPMHIAASVKGEDQPQITS